jgi:CSLREA domain-containing protein
MESRTLPSIMVDTFADTVDANDGFTSLREAIAQADADTIVLPHQIGGVEGTYTLSLGVLSIADAGPLAIQSDGGPATIDARGSSQVFSMVHPEVACANPTPTQVVV